MLQILQHTTEARFHPHSFFYQFIESFWIMAASQGPCRRFPTLLCELGNLARDRVGGDSTGTRDHEDRRTVRSINIEWREVPTFQNVHNVYREASILNIRTV